MLRYYKAYVRSCLDYGCQAYSSAKPNALRLLDSIHNSAIRLATGAFRSSPVISLYAECGEPSLHNRRVQLMGNYFFSLKSKPGNPAHDLVFNNQNTCKYALKQTAPRPFGVRISLHLDDLLISPMAVKLSHQSRVPPWTVNNVKVDISLSMYLKSNTSDAVYKRLFQERLNALKPCDVVYTDGSKFDAGTGCAFVTSTREYKFNLPPASSIYTAELTAIQKALCIVCPRTRTLVVCSDSLSSLMAIRDMYSKNALVREIHSAACYLGRRGTQVVLLWSPGHVGLSGNELADRAAKQAVDLPLCTARVVSSDVKAVITKKINRCISEDWQNIRDNKLRSIKNSSVSWRTSCRASRREEVVLCRLRIGHTTLTHGFLMERGDPPMCAVCNVALTVKHILMDCVLYTSERLAHHLPHTLSEALGDDDNSVARVLAFLKDAGLMSRI